MSDDLIDGMPRLIQAGMGIHVSSANLANHTARLGALGVVSGAALRHVVVEDIRAGNAEAIELARTFPEPRYVDELLAFAPGGARQGEHADSPCGDSTMETTATGRPSLVSVPLIHRDGLRELGQSFMSG